MKGSTTSEAEFQILFWPFSAANFRRSAFEKFLAQDAASWQQTVLIRFMPGVCSLRIPNFHGNGRLVREIWSEMSEIVLKQCHGYAQISSTILRKSARRDPVGCVWVISLDSEVPYLCVCYL